uniref:Uncharacterized protein n=1 Tax=Fagus sylvatica TaxID=28930 RepID=A0A2N9GRR3_FAGSY
MLNLCLVTRLRPILISYGNQVRHLTESTPHLEQVSSENPGDEALAASPSTTHEPATACQMKGHKLPRCPKIGRPPEGHVFYSAARPDCRPLIPELHHYPYLTIILERGSVNFALGCSLRGETVGLLPEFVERMLPVETAFLGAEEWKTCKRITAGRNWHRFGAGQRGSDAFVSIDSQKNLERRYPFWSVVLSRVTRLQPPIFALKNTLEEKANIPWMSFSFTPLAQKTMEDFHAERDFEETGEGFGSRSSKERRPSFLSRRHLSLLCWGFRTYQDSENEDEEDDIQSKEHAVTPSEVQSTSPSGDQSGDPAVSLMDGQVILPPIDKEAP